MSTTVEIRRPTARSLPVYLVLLLVVGALGYGSRRYDYLLPLLIRKRTGDALWASAVFLALCLLWRRGSTLKLAVAALVISFAVEFSQLYHAPWIDALRRRRAGAILLGWAFYWRDLIAYAVGVVVAGAVDAVLMRVNIKDRSSRR